jgi:hypothetical protein
MTNKNIKHIKIEYLDFLKVANFSIHYYILSFFIVLIISFIESVILSRIYFYSYADINKIFVLNLISVFLCLAGTIFGMIIGMNTHRSELYSEKIIHQGDEEHE